MNLLEVFGQLTPLMSRERGFFKPIDTIYISVYNTLSMVVERTNLSKILIARKLTLFEYDQKRTGLSSDDLLKRYADFGADLKNILESHKRQISSFKGFLLNFPDPKVIVGETLTKRDVKNASLVISFGGDNFFQYVSHFLDMQLVAGVNSDPLKSDGALTSFEPGSFIKFLSNLIEGRYDIEEWARLQAFKNGKKLSPLAVSEIFIGARESIDMSRYILSVNGVGEEQKSSGILISTGTGSTGWYNSTYKYSHHGKNGIFPKQSNYARFIIREPYMGRLSKHKTFGGWLRTHEKLEVRWLAHGKGVVSIDPEVNYQLRRGDQVSVVVADSPLRVVVPRSHLGKKA